MILEEAPAESQRTEIVERPRHVLTISARSPQALAALADRYAGYLEAHPDALVPDVAYTANVGRTHFTNRAAIVAASLEELRERLKHVSRHSDAPGVLSGEAPHDSPGRIAFLFTGQGAQYPGMGLGLYGTQPVFREAINSCAQILRPHLDRPLLSLLDPQAGTVLDQTGNTQPVMFAVEYALARLWQSWGIEPTAVMGHSLGEFVAACVAGVLTLEDGLRLIAQRARLMQSLPSGGLMAAVFTTEAEVRSAIETDRVSIAALNGPRSIVVSGDEPAVRELLRRFEEKGISSKTLVTSHAFHSYRMDPILGTLEEAAALATPAPPKIDLVSNLTGRLADPGTYAQPGYWSRHARSPVRFAEGIEAMVAAGCDIFLEIGPSPTLIGMGRQCLPENGRQWLPSLRPGATTGRRSWRRSPGYTSAV